MHNEDWRTGREHDLPTPLGDDEHPWYCGCRECDDEGEGWPL